MYNRAEPAGHGARTARVCERACALRARVGVYMGLPHSPLARVRSHMTHHDRRAVVDQQHLVRAHCDRLERRERLERQRLTRRPQSAGDPFESVRDGLLSLGRSMISNVHRLVHALGGEGTIGVGWGGVNIA